MSRYGSLARPERLGPALAAALCDERWRSPRVELVSGGKSNLTFRLSCTAGVLVLRRPPSGALLPKAHDMGREVRVQRALSGTRVPVPEIVLTDPDGELLGVPCYVMREVPGHVLRDELPVGYAPSPADKVAIADALIDVLADLHDIDPHASGLTGNGRPEALVTGHGGAFVTGHGQQEAFFTRQLRVWQRQWQNSRTVDTPAVEALLDRLARTPPAPGRVAIVHGDYRLDNCLMDPADPGRVAAVLDWELSTLGDPLADLGMLLFYWTQAGEPKPVLTPALTATPGFPPRRHLVERYVDRTGADIADLVAWHAFAHLKFAVIAQGVWTRAAAGKMADQDFGDLSGEVARIAEAGLRLLDKEG